MLSLVIDVKVNLSRYAMPAPRGEEYSLYSFSTLALDGVSGHRPRFTAGERTPDTRWTGGWIYTQRLEEKKAFAFAGDRKPVVQSVVRHYTD
jgi:hypothetical protein